jgi:uncharacterized membrane protein (DUF2068 family)
MILIAIGKILKSIGLVASSFLFRALLSEEKHKAIEDWLNNARLEPHSWVLHRCFDVVEKSLDLQHGTLRLLHLGVIIYAALYLIEGIGLWFDRKWAEWMVIVTTAGFLPLEVYEIWKEMTPARCLLFAANVVVMAYLIFRLRRQYVIKKEQTLLRAFPVESAKAPAPR